MDKIKVEGIRLYGYHGCLDEEGKIGTEYRIDVTVWGDTAEAAETDDLKQTMDYVIINRIVEDEMKERSKLIEHVAKRILKRLMREMEMVQKAKIKLSKLYPPINGDVESVSTVMKIHR